MSISPPRFTELPIELSERILLHMPGMDIVKMETVSRYFMDIVRDSPILQYRRELFTAGLTDNHDHSCNLVERRKLCEEYAKKWAGTARLVKRVHEIPVVRPTLVWGDIIALGGDLLVLYPYSKGCFEFLHVPPVTSQRSIERWTIPELPFSVDLFAVYAPDSLLVVSERRGQSVHIHFLKLQDGSPYGAQPSREITYELPPGTGYHSVHQLAVTRSRVMMCAYAQYEGGSGTVEVERTIVWDTKTGYPVLNVSTGDKNVLIRGSSRATFLDEFRMLMASSDSVTGAPELVVFDTIVPQDHSNGFRRFRFPPSYCGQTYRVHVDCDRPLGTATRDAPFMVDPTQAVLVAELYRVTSGPRVLLIMRLNSLIKHMCSMRADPCISWEEWGTGTVAMEVPFYRKRFFTFVYGTRVLVAAFADDDDQPRHFLYTFDFSKWGCRALPLWSGEDGGIERKFVFEDGRRFVLEGDLDMSPWDMVLLGNGMIAHYLDMTFRPMPESGIPLEVWEVI